MTRFPCAIFGALLGTAVAVTPIQKVLEMMNTMKAKGTEEKKAEEVAFAKFQQWCSNTQQAKREAIDRGAREIEDLSAAIEKAFTDIEELSERIAELDEDVARWHDDEKAATAVREKEKADYKATQKDYSDTIDACERARAVLNAMPKNVAQSMLQTTVKAAVDAALMPEHARKTLQAFLQVVQDPELAYDAPEANAYVSQTGAVHKMIVDLRNKFRDELAALEKEELGTRHAYEAIMQTMTDNIDLAEQEINQKSKVRAQRKEEKADAEGTKAEAARVKAQDETYLTDATNLCTIKAQDFESRHQLRSEELEALDKAIGIIAGLKEPSAVAAGGALAQLRSVKKANHDHLEQALALLKSRAASTKSEVLAGIAQKANAAAKQAEDPFAKVKKLIRDLITKLMEQANEEADHKGWCDAELATNKQNRQIKTDEVDSLTTEMETLTADIAQLSQSLDDLTGQVSELQKSIAEAEADRNAEKFRNAKSVEEADLAADAVGQALAVLRAFYAKAAEATALTQQQQSPADDAPETFDSSFKGQQAESGGIVAMLEVLESDFARLSAEASSSEVVSEANFKIFKAESEQDMTVNQAEIEHKSSKREQKELELESTKGTLARANEELDAAVAYYQKLKPSCVDSGLSYEERVERRKEEIQSLTEAYKIMSGEDLPSFKDIKAEQLDSSA